MEVYTFPEQEFADTYLIQGTELNSQFSSPSLEAMYREGAPEFSIDQALYYPPTPTNYAYLCTGLESPGEWDGYHRVFGLDGQDIQCAGSQTEAFPSFYYTPSFGYGQTLYNPYNPYIPGAMVEVSCPFLGSQPYYTAPTYENPSSAPLYLPGVVQSRSDLIANNTTDPFLRTTTSTANRADRSGLKQTFSSASSAFSPNLLGPASSKTNSVTMVSGGNKTNATARTRSMTDANVTSNRLTRLPSNQNRQGGGSQALEYMPPGKVLPSHGQFRIAQPSVNGVAVFGSTLHEEPTKDKVQSRFLYGRGSNGTELRPDAYSDQNRGQRDDKPKNQLTVKAYTTWVGDADAEGNIIIDTHRYNKDDFSLEYTSAKFFVIKSYSEDDVHKSIKYSIWSSTPNGNKKLNSAYEDSQRLVNEDSGNCPVFLFFSVNASGQFCGVAEMTGPVDFHRDMDFWQQDKWSGSFPVKWHIIKDVLNPAFRRIILENNEYKPVTNSRDTQEVPFRKGIEILKIFKNCVYKTSLLDDFMFYENRQRLLQAEKARLLMRNYKHPVPVSVLDSPEKLTSKVDCTSKEDDTNSKYKDLNYSDHDTAASIETVDLDSGTKNSSAANEDVLGVADEEASTDSVLKIGTLTINRKQSGTELLGVVTAGSPSDAVTVGSVLVEVKETAAKSPGLLTFGTIDFDPTVLEQSMVFYGGKGG